jgi:DNA repair protein RecO (recombination protein O)
MRSTTWRRRASCGCSRDWPGSSRSSPAAPGRPGRRFGGGAALDLFAEGEAQYHEKPGRELHTLSGFDVMRSRAALALDIGRFTAASVLAELILRFARDDAQPALYDAFVDALDVVAAAPPTRARDAGLAGAWRLVAELGFAPSLEACCACHAPVATDRPAAFSHPAGGVLCAPCARLGGANRLLPPGARATIAAWTGEGSAATANDAPLDEPAARAHQRLLREFLREHLTDGRPLRALEIWEGDRWGVGAAAGEGGGRA